MTRSDASASSAIIRPARGEDIFALSDLYGETQRATYHGIIPHDALEYAIARRKPDWWRRNLDRGSKTLILEQDGRAQGYVSFGPSRYGDIVYQGEIYEIYIRPGFQGRGFGGELFETARNSLGEDGHSGLMLWTIASNDRAVGFFRHKGAIEFAESEINYRSRTLLRVAMGWPEHPIS